MLVRKEFRGSSWQMADAFWRQIESLLPRYSVSSGGGRPRANLRQVMEALPREFGSGSTVHRYFQQWTEQGVFGKAWRRMLKRYDQRRRIGWNWQSVDGSMTKAPLGGGKNRQKPYRSR
jgi:transposase